LKKNKDDQPKAFSEIKYGTFQNVLIRKRKPILRKVCVSMKRGKREKN